MSKVHLFFCANATRDVVCGILEELDKKYDTVATAYINNCISVYHGKYTATKEQCKEIKLTFNPVRTTPEVEELYVNEFRNVIKERCKQHFVPYYPLNI